MLKKIEIRAKALRDLANDVRHRGQLEHIRQKAVSLYRLVREAREQLEKTVGTVDE
jgi:hypothetical protein